MNKEGIAVDIDEVLFPFLDEFIKDHNDLYGTNLMINDFPSYEFSGTLGLGILDTVERVYSFQSRLDQSKIAPLQESKESIAKVASKYDINIVTARHPQFEDETVEWLNTHFMGNFVSTTFIGFPEVMEKPLTKAEVCKEIGAVALIDDSLKHLLQCSEVGIEGILFGDYPWNQTDSLPENISRCTNWIKVLDHLNIN